MYAADGKLLPLIQKMATTRSVATRFD